MLLFRFEEIGISAMGITTMVYANTFERYQFFSNFITTIITFQDLSGTSQRINMNIFPLHYNLPIEWGGKKHKEIQETKDHADQMMSNCKDSREFVMMQFPVADSIRPGQV
jgi:hypothetical protein